jgi:hypothetical protein
MAPNWAIDREKAPFSNEGFACQISNWLGSPYLEVSGKDSLDIVGFHGEHPILAEGCALPRSAKTRKPVSQTFDIRPILHGFNILNEDVKAKDWIFMGIVCDGLALVLLCESIALNLHINSATELPYC